MTQIDRREFLKLAGAGAGAAATVGCEPVEKLIPYVVQPEEITPGLPVIYASTCTGCEANCGLHVRTREGRPIKLEGNPEHPVNQGALCARGQAGIGVTYHPDRFQQPLQRSSGGELEPLSWDQATERLVSALKGAKGKVGILGGTTGPTLSGLLDRWLAAVGGGTRVVYEPFADEALEAATESVFGEKSRPIFDLSGSDLVIDFGADSLGTWISPVEHARQLADARDVAREEGRSARLIAVGPRQDITASCADRWLPARPGTEGILALGIAREAFDRAHAAGHSPGGDPDLLARVLSRFDAESVSERTGIDAATIRELGAAMAHAKRPAALPPGTALRSRRATETTAAVLVLNAVSGAIGNTVQIPAAADSQPGASSFREVAKLIDAMRSGDIKVLLVYGANPVFSLPPDAGFVEALAQVETVVSFASVPDETAATAHLVLPDHTPLESWGDAQPRPGVRSLVQPTLRPLYDTQALGDVLLQTARAMGGDTASRLPSGSFREVVESAWSDTDWHAALRRGGVFTARAHSEARSVVSGVAKIEFKEPQLEGDGGFVLLAHPSPLLGDGGGANLPWLQETPDPVTKITWQSWAEISQDTAQSLGVSSGDVLSIETAFGALEVPAWPRGGIRDDVVAVAVGQGHSVGMWASAGEGIARGQNVISVLPAHTDEAGGRAWLSARARVTPTGRNRRLPYTQGTDNKRGRQLGESVSLAALAAGGVEAYADAHDEHGGGHGESHEIRLPYDAADDSAADSPYRWGMTIDVDRCTGCSACVVACSVENNIPVVGEEGVMRNRQMSWLRIERYVGDGYQQLQTGRRGPQNHEGLGEADVRNSPMLCQQCGAAPCEPVCPVFATYHSPSGLNGMIYNRCIGTRYCSNNCPYKVRRYNWFDYQIEGWPEPMPLMLNPDVTVRGQGVMEKCTFCVQRVEAAKQVAKDEGRPVKDGEVQTACQQTCPTDAIQFGNLKDPEARAIGKADENEARSYHALHVLNTRPAVTYLARVKREETGASESHAKRTEHGPHGNEEIEG